MVVCGGFRWSVAVCGLLWFVEVRGGLWCGGSWRFAVVVVRGGSWWFVVVGGLWWWLPKLCDGVWLVCGDLWCLVHLSHGLRVCIAFVRFCICAFVLLCFCCVLGVCGLWWFVMVLVLRWFECVYAVEHLCVCVVCFCAFVNLSLCMCACLRLMHV